ncbi:MAG: hypothetical protein LUC34_06515 [Campylobacter sp.]|nr:hypothetical protein [Campylobacter sp.]
MRKIFFVLLLVVLNLAADSNLQLVKSLFTDRNFDKNLYFKDEMPDKLKTNFYVADKADTINVEKLGSSDEFSENFRVSLSLKDELRDLYI